MVLSEKLGSTAALVGIVDIVGMSESEVQVLDRHQSEAEVHHVAAAAAGIAESIPLNFGTVVAVVVLRPCDSTHPRPSSDPSILSLHSS